MNRNKFLTVILASILILGQVPLTQAQMKDNTEAARPDGIDVLHQNTLAIDYSFMEAKQIPLPPLASTKVVTVEQGAAAPSSAQVLDNVFKTEDQNKLMDLDF